MAPVVLDWRRHKIGPRRPCRHCRRGALMRDKQGKPCHKMCAEADIERRAAAAAAPTNPGRMTTA